MRLKKGLTEYQPIKINWLVLEKKGKIGLTGYPGKNRFLFSDSLDRDLKIIKKSATLLVTLIQKSEFELLYLDDIEDKAAEYGLEWIHAPIRDFSVPDDIFMEKWPVYSSHIRGLLNSGKSIVIHCWGGYGRTGLTAAMLLIDMGFKPDEAVKLVRKTRAGTIETKEQEAFCLAYTGTSDI